MDNRNTVRSAAAAIFGLALIASTPCPAETVAVRIDPGTPHQRFDGWGVSLCWWANMVGKWDDEKVSAIVVDYVAGPPHGRHPGALTASNTSVRHGIY